MDNGAPWGSSKDLPTELVLWWLGLGIEPEWIPPRRPDRNGVVERSQGTGKRWAEPRRCATAAELQRRLNAADRIQREAYPSVNGRSRLAAYPELVRAGGAGWRRRPWRLQPVLDHLAEYSLPRKVDQVGYVSVYGRNLYVGKPHRGHLVHLSLDPLTKQWVVHDRAGRMLSRLPACELTQERIVGLDVARNARRLQLAKAARGKTPWPI